MRCLKHKYQKYKKRKMKQKNTFMHRDDLSNDNKNYTKARDYKIETGKISFVSTTVSTVITLAFLWFEGFGILSDYIAADYSSPFIQTAIFFLVLFIFNAIISIGLPRKFDIW